MNTKKILLLLSEGFEIYEASVFIDVFGWNNIYGSKDTKIDTCAKRKHIRSTFSIPIEVDKIVHTVNPDDYEALAIPGGFEIYGFYNDAFSPEFSDIIKDFDRKGKPIASICVGALCLGKSGILKNRNATTYNIAGSKRIEQLREFEAYPINSPIVIDRNVVTSSSPSTAINVAFDLLKTLTNEENCNSIKKLMGFNL